MTTDLVPAGKTEKRPFLRFAEKRFFGQKSVSLKKKNTRNLLKTDIYLGKGYFFFAQLCPVVARKWLELVRIEK